MEDHKEPVDQLFDIELERKLFGACLDTPELWLDVRRSLYPDDFAEPRHIIIAHTIETLIEKNIRPSTELVVRKLQDDNRLKDAGGKEYILGLAEERKGMGRTGWMDVPLWAKRLDGLASRRHMLNIAHKISKQAMDMRVDERELWQEMARIVGEGKRKRREDFRSIASNIDKLQDLTAAWLRGERAGYISTGFKSLDYLIGGLSRRRMMIIGGRPSMGKSMILQNIIAHVSKNVGAVAVSSLEMALQEWQFREMIRIANVDGLALKRGAYAGDRDAEERIKAALEQVQGNKNVYINDSPIQSAAEMELQAAMLSIQVPDLVLFAVDYAELIQDAQENNGGAIAVANAFRRMKGLAKATNTAVIVLSQLNREVDKTDSMLPGLSHLRYGGEAEADVVAMMYWPSKAKTKRGWIKMPPWVAENKLAKDDRTPFDNVLILNVVKARDGREGYLPMKVSPGSYQIKDYYDDRVFIIGSSGQGRGL